MEQSLLTVSRAEDSRGGRRGGIVLRAVNRRCRSSRERSNLGSALLCQGCRNAISCNGDTPVQEMSASWPPGPSWCPERIGHRTERWQLPTAGTTAPALLPSPRDRLSVAAAQPKKQRRIQAPLSGRLHAVHEVDGKATAASNPPLHAVTSTVETEYSCNGDWRWCAVCACSRAPFGLPDLECCHDSPAPHSIDRTRACSQQARGSFCVHHHPTPSIPLGIRSTEKPAEPTEMMSATVHPHAEDQPHLFP